MTINTEGMFDSESPYAKAADHEGLAEQTTIEAAGLDEYDEKEFVWVKPANVEKPIRLNKTNGRALATAFGTDAERWVGKPVFLATREYTLDSGKSIGWVFTPVRGKPAEQPNDDIPF